MTIRHVVRVQAGQLDTSTQFTQQQRQQGAALKEPIQTSAKQDLHVDLSAAARMSSGAEAQKSNDDIEQSDLPEVLKILLKQLREIRQKIMEKLAELQKVMQDHKLPAELRKQRMQMLQSEIMGLEAAYIGINKEIEKLSRNDSLSAEQKMTMMQLMNA